MQRPFPFVAALLLALMTSAGGYVLANALCSDAGRVEASCHQKGQASPRARHDHAGTTHQSHGAMKHDSHAANIDATAVGSEERFETCSHCVSHSNLPQSAFDLRQAETSRSSSQVDGPAAVATVIYDVLIPRAISAREHAPPGNPAPLHVRLNVFRI